MNKVILGIFAVVSASMAGTLSTHLAVDNQFALYISTTDTALGTLVASGSDSPLAIGFENLTLTSGVTNYIHLLAFNNDGNGGFVGDFTLGGAFQFANGTQRLLTNAVDFKQSRTGFGVDYVNPADLGENGVSPWNSVASVDASAHWLWADPSCTSCSVYFSAAIDPTASVAVAAPVPEPGSLILIGGGLLALFAYRRRRS